MEYTHQYKAGLRVLSHLVLNNAEQIEKFLSRYDIAFSEVPKHEWLLEELVELLGSGDPAVLEDFTPLLADHLSDHSEELLDLGVSPSALGLEDHFLGGVLKVASGLLSGLTGGDDGSDTRALERQAILDRNRRAAQAEMEATRIRQRQLMEDQRRDEEREDRRRRELRKEEREEEARERQQKFLQNGLVVVGGVVVLGFLAWFLKPKAKPKTA